MTETSTQREAPMSRIASKLPFISFVMLCLLWSSLASCSRASPTNPLRDASPSEELSKVESPPSLENASLLWRFDLGAGSKTPGSKVVWRIEVAHLVSGVHVTPNGEVVAIGPNQITFIDQKGRHLWHRNMAPGDTVLPSADCLYVHLASGSIVSSLDDRGEPRWERNLEGTLAPLGDGKLLSVDATAVRVLQCRTGSEAWMFSAGRMRSLRFLSLSRGNVSLLGEIGRRRVLFTLGPDGQLLSTTELPLESDVAVPMSTGTILARTTNSLRAVEPSGQVLWTQPISTRTELGLHDDHIILADSSADGTVRARVLTQQGTMKSICMTTLGAEPVSVKIMGHEPLLLAACAGALSSCADRGLSSGPYNRLWGCSTDDGETKTLVTQRSKLYFDMAQAESFTVAVATPDNGQSTYVIKLDSRLHRTRLAKLNERRMLGPIPGPNGLWLVATCHGVRCEAPWTLLAIAGQEEE